jgi:glycolate oxidase
MRQAIVEELAAVVGRPNVLTRREALRAYSYDATTSWINEPEAVVFPTSAHQTSAILKIANREGIPVTPRGAGTGLSGGSVPIRGGVVLCTTRMNRILEVDKENMKATVEPGVVLLDLNMRLARDNLFFPPDPQSLNSATLGGMIAENSGGPACVKYGVTKQYVMGLEVVLPTAEIVNLGGMTLNNVAGYDLLHLIISSEGTLGVITKAVLKVIALPPARQTILAVYDDVATPGENVFRVLESGVVPAKIELIDNWVINKFEDMMHIGLPREADAVLLFEVDGVQEAVEQETAKIAEIAHRCGAREVRIAKDADEANKYWMGRKAGFAAVYGAAATIIAEDVAVPRGRIPDLMRKCKELARRYDVEIVVLGHAGDGNFHPAILTDIKDSEHYQRASGAMDEIIATAVELGGVISGEHGIGLEKAKFFGRTVHPGVVDLTKKIKALFDPKGIMNPGKIWE